MMTALGSKTLRRRHEESAIVAGCGVSLICILGGQMWVVLGMAILMVLCLLIPSIAMVVHHLWTGLGKTLALINGTLILGALFYWVLSPLALLRRSLARRKPSPKTYFVDENRKFCPSDLENPW